MGIAAVRVVSGASVASASVFPPLYWSSGIVSEIEFRIERGHF